MYDENEEEEYYINEYDMTEADFLYRTMNPDDPWYMGPRDDAAPDVDGGVPDLDAPDVWY